MLTYGYGSSVYTSQSTGWDCVAWPGVYTLCASALYTATSATTSRAVDVIGNITANWTFWQCRGHLKTHFKPALSLSLRVRRHSLPGEGKTFNCYGSSVYTSQSTGWDCVAWPGVYTLCASAFYTATNATTSRERTSSAHSNVKQGRRSCRKNGERDTW